MPAGEYPQGLVCLASLGVHICEEKPSHLARCVLEQHRMSTLELTHPWLSWFDRRVRLDQSIHCFFDSRDTQDNRIVLPCLAQAQVLYPQSMADSSEFDCLDPILTLSMIPSKLDLDQNGYWSIDEAASLGRTLKDKGSQMTNFSAVLIRMAKYDFKNRIGSKSAFKQMQHVDMDFFKHFRGNIEMCLPIDPNLCGNLEARGRLSGILPEMDAEERVQACRDNFDSFCTWLVVSNDLSKKSNMPPGNPRTKRRF